MRRLLTLDSHNYTEDMPVFEKTAVKAIIRNEEGLIAMQQDGDEVYKIPGGGLEEGESLIDALEREVLEETGLVIVRESVTLIGEVLEMREDIHKKGVKYVAHSYFYYCDVEKETRETHMTASEIAKGFRPVWATVEDIINTNREKGKTLIADRDTAIMEMLKNKEI